MSPRDGNVGFAGCTMYYYNLEIRSHFQYLSKNFNNKDNKKIWYFCIKKTQEGFHQNMETRNTQFWITTISNLLLTHPVLSNSFFKLSGLSELFCLYTIYKNGINGQCQTEKGKPCN